MYLTDRDALSRAGQQTQAHTCQPSTLHVFDLGQKTKKRCEPPLSPSSRPHRMKIEHGFMSTERKESNLKNLNSFVITSLKPGYGNEFPLPNKGNLWRIHGHPHTQPPKIKGHIGSLLLPLINTVMELPVQIIRQGKESERDQPRAGRTTC